MSCHSSGGVYISHLPRIILLSKLILYFGNFSRSVLESRLDLYSHRLFKELRKENLVNPNDLVH